MITSNASVPESIGLEHLTSVHLRHAFLECIEDQVIH